LIGWRTSPSSEESPTATNGWGYATFGYDEASDTWTAFAPGRCHTVVRARDFVWTSYPNR